MNCVENSEGEIWRYVMSEEIGFYPYMVSNIGRVKSLNYNKTGDEKLVKQWKTKNGYLRVSLHCKGKRKMFLVHQLVALMFIPNPDNLPFINHKDENPSNNNVENLEWCSVLYNNTYGTKIERFKETIKNSDAWKEGRERRKETIKNSDAWKEHITKLHAKKRKQVYQYTTDGIFVEVYASTRSAATATGFNQSAISKSCRTNINLSCTTKHNSYKGFIWCYEPIETEKN